MAQSMLDYRILEKLAAEKIPYFSFTLFRNGQPQVSQCNYSEWMDIYNQRYHNNDTKTLLKKYVLNANANTVMWEYIIESDPIAKKYIQERNEVTRVSSNITLVYPFGPYLSAMTLGAPNPEDLFNFFSKEKAFLKWIEKNLIYVPLKLHSINNSTEN